MAKPKRRKASVHSTAKVQESDLLARARALAEDPSPIVPVCEGGCVLFSPVAAARRGIAKAHVARDDEKRLQSLANGGNELARAYAATLLLTHGERIPYVGEIRLPGITAAYAPRGKAKPLFLAGVQNHEDKQLRLLAYATWVKKRGLHFYSLDEGVLCTGKRSAPPRAFVEQELEALDLAPDGTTWSCPHPDADAVKISWKDAGVEIVRCAACAHGDGSTLAALLRHMAVPDALRGFDVGARLRPLAGEAADVDPAIPEDARRAYVGGALADSALLEAARAGRLDALRSAGRKLLVAGDRSYGEDADAFLAALNASPAEARAIRAALAVRTGALVVEKPTSARALAELWPAHGRAMLEAAGGDAEVAARLHKPTASPEEAAELVRRADKEGSHRSALSILPAYRALPPAAAAADALARAFRTGGQELAVRQALDARPKGIALAVLEELNAAKGQEWRFSHADRDVAASVAAPIKELLRGDPARYHEALVDASRRSGETGTFAPVA